MLGIYVGGFRKEAVIFAEISCKRLRVRKTLQGTEK